MGSSEYEEDAESSETPEGDPGSSEAPVSGQPGGGLDGPEGPHAEDEANDDEDGESEAGPDSADAG